MRSGRGPIVLVVALFVGACASLDGLLPDTTPDAGPGASDDAGDATVPPPDGAGADGAQPGDALYPPDGAVPEGGDGSVISPPDGASDPDAESDSSLLTDAGSADEGDASSVFLCMPGETQVGPLTAATSNTDPLSGAVKSWNNIGHVRLSDDSYTQSDLGPNGEYSSYCAVKGFTATIPLPATVTALYAAVERSTTCQGSCQADAGASDHSVRFTIGGTSTGTDMARVGLWPKVDETAIYGGSLATLGVAPATLDLATLGIGVSAIGVGDAQNLVARIDAIQLYLCY